MKEKYIALLSGLQTRIDEAGFDLLAWKSAAIPLLETIFGPQNPKVKQLDAIRIEYGSSWTIRDVTGDYDPVRLAKKRCGEVVRLAIDELDALGVPATETPANALVGAMEAALKVSQIKALKKIVDGEAVADYKQTQLAGKLASFGGEACAAILAQVILAEGI